MQCIHTLSIQATGNLLSMCSVLTTNCSINRSANNDLFCCIFRLQRNLTGSGSRILFSGCMEEEYYFLQNLEVIYCSILTYKRENGTLFLILLLWDDEQYWTNGSRYGSNNTPNMMNQNVQWNSTPGCNKLDSATAGIP